MCFGSLGTLCCHPTTIYVLSFCRIKTHFLKKLVWFLNIVNHVGVLKLPPKFFGRFGLENNLYTIAQKENFNPLLLLAS